MMKKLEMTQMEKISGGADDIDCLLAGAGAVLGVAGGILSGGLALFGSALAIANAVKTCSDVK